MFFFFNDTATTEIYTLSLHDALPISSAYSAVYIGDSAHPYLDMTNIQNLVPAFVPTKPMAPILITDRSQRDRKSTRLNSSHSQISYAVFCLKKKIALSNSTNPLTTAT